MIPPWPLLLAVGVGVGVMCWLRWRTPKDPHRKINTYRWE